MRDVALELVSFARGPVGEWRFVGYPWVEDEDEAVSGLVVVTTRARFCRNYPTALLRCAPEARCVCGGRIMCVLVNG
jgi:hypothetical protein